MIAINLQVKEMKDGSIMIRKLMKHISGGSKFGIARKLNANVMESS